ncbi:MAG: PP2C family protein-serine/threonine phosphatase [Bacteroidota bacterium]
MSGHIQQRLYSALISKDSVNGVRFVSALKLALGSQVGSVRKVNEDRLAVAYIKSLDGSVTSVYALSDGVGGLNSGDECSTLTIAAFFAACLENRDLPLEDCLLNSANSANKEVFAKYGGRGGATLSAIACNREGICRGVNIGDSRIYLFNGNLEQHSKDDTLRGQLIGYVANVNSGNELLQYVGMGEGLQPHIIAIPNLDKPFSFLLTSDGTHVVGDQNLNQILKNSPSMEYTLKRIMALSSWWGGVDNGSLMLGEIDPTYSRNKKYDEVDLPQLVVHTPTKEIEFHLSPYDLTLKLRNKVKTKKSINPALKEATLKMQKNTLKSNKPSKVKIEVEPNSLIKDDEIVEPKGAEQLKINLENEAR